MSLERSAQKNHLESEYERYRKQAERARKEGHGEKAARYYRQCAVVLRDLAELESSDHLRRERLDLAENLETAAGRLEEGEPLDGDEAEESGDADGSAGGRSGGASSGDASGGPRTGRRGRGTGMHPIRPSTSRSRRRSTSATSGG
jgi:transitional endoplasmic reticulum ATPase